MHEHDAIQSMQDVATDPAFEHALAAACDSIGVHLEPFHVTQMWRHFCRVRTTNERFNLTRITDPRRAAVEHYADSLTLLPWLAARAGGRRPPRRALDVGTGGGWPAVPLAIVRPDIAWMAIDSTGKKARFVAEAAKALRLANLTVRQARAREMAGKAAPFDLIAARAVGKLADLIAETARLLAGGGHLVCYKTARLSEDERAAGLREAARAGLVPQPDFPITLAAEGDELHRLLVAYRRA